MVESIATLPAPVEPPPAVPVAGNVEVELPDGIKLPRRAASL